MNCPELIVKDLPAREPPARAVTIAGRIALLLALAACGAGAALAGSGASPGTARVQVAAQVMPVAKLDSGRHPAAVRVTARDVERGYVEVLAATPYQLRANVPFDVQVRLVAGWLRTVTIRGFAGDLEAGPGGATFLHPPTVPGRLAGELSYRFELAPGVQPGSHGWPVALAVIIAR